MRDCYDHIDLRVSDLKQSEPFYSALLTARGFTRNASIAGWLTFEAINGDITEFFGVMESQPRSERESFRILV